MIYTHILNRGRTAFKQTTVQRISSGETTLAELARELDRSRPARFAPGNGSPRRHCRPSARAHTASTQLITRRFGQVWEA